MRKLEFFPQRSLENIMMTSMLADKLVIVKNKKLMKFMNEIINPPCISLISLFYELSFQVCLKKASSCLKRLACPKRTLSQLIELLFLLPLLISPKKRLLEREVRRVLREVQLDQLTLAACARQRLARRQMWRTKMRTLMLLVALTRLGLWVQV